MSCGPTAGKPTSLSYSPLSLIYNSLIKLLQLMEFRTIVIMIIAHFNFSIPSFLSTPSQFPTRQTQKFPSCHCVATLPYVITRLVLRKNGEVGTDYAAHDYDVLYDTIQCTRQLGTKYRYAPTRNKVLCDTVQTNNTKELRKNTAYFGPNTVYSCSKIQRTGWRTSRVKRSSVMTPDSDNALVVQH